VSLNRALADLQLEKTAAEINSIKSWE